MAVLQISDGSDPSNLAEIELQLDIKRPKQVKWKCRTPGAFRDIVALEDWQCGYVIWSKNRDDEYTDEVFCCMDYDRDGMLCECFSLAGVFRTAQTTYDSGSGAILTTRAGFLATGEMTWRSLGF